MANHSDEPTEIDYDQYSRSSLAAHRFIIDGKEYWIPKSQMTDWDKEEKTFCIPEWLAFEKELI